MTKATATERTFNAKRDLRLRKKREVARSAVNRHAALVLEHDDDDDGAPMAWELTRDRLNAELAEEGFEPMTSSDWHDVVFWLTWEARDLLNAARLCTINAAQLNDGGEPEAA
jgi:hypothetical protein